MMNLLTITKDTAPECSTEETISDALTTRTPFHMEDGWEFVTDNTNASCSHAEIETLIQKRIINLIDIEIMKVLATYHYINHYNLLTALKMRLHTGYQKASYLSNIRKLKKAGILLSYRPVCSSDMAAGFIAPPAAPLRLYCLSQSAGTYMERICDSPHPLLPSSARRKVELAAAGQFLIQFSAHYDERIIGIEYQKGTKLGNTPFLIDAVIRYHMVLPRQQEESLVTLLLLSVREHKNWEKSALSRIHLLRVWLSRHESESLLPLPVLLVENINMATTLYAKIYSMETLAGFSVYFCPDSLLLAYPPLQALYRCEISEDGKVTAVRMGLDKE